MLNKLPIIGWIFTFIGATSLSVPFWVCWTWFGIGEKYFYFLPQIFQIIPFWDSVGLFLVLAIIKPTLTPTVVNVSQTNTKG